MSSPPPGWPRISPSLFYDDAPAAIDFLCRAFGFELQLKVDGDDGIVVHSQLVLPGALVMVSSSGRRPGHVSPRAVGGANTQSLLVQVDDADAHCARAREAGARILSEPATSDYGEEYWADRLYEAEDPGGHRWWFSHRVRTGGK